MQTLNICIRYGRSCIVFKENTTAHIFQRPVFLTPLFHVLSVLKEKKCSQVCSSVQWRLLKKFNSLNSKAQLLVLIYRSTLHCEIPCKSIIMQNLHFQCVIHNCHVCAKSQLCNVERASHWSSWSKLCFELWFNMQVRLQNKTFSRPYCTADKIRCGGTPFWTFWPLLCRMFEVHSQNTIANNHHVVFALTLCRLLQTEFCQRTGSPLRGNFEITSWAALNS